MTTTPRFFPSWVDDLSVPIEDLWDWIAFASFVASKLPIPDQSLLPDHKPPRQDLLNHRLPVGIAHWFDDDWYEQWFDST